MLTGRDRLEMTGSAPPCAARAGGLVRLPASFAVIGDLQWLPGHCVVLADDRAATRLAELHRPWRLEFPDSMYRLGKAVEVACAAADLAFRRVSLEILGNTDAFLRARVWLRYDWEPPDRTTRATGSCTTAGKSALNAGRSHRGQDQRAH